MHRPTIDDLAPPLRQYFDIDVQQLEPGAFRGKMEFVIAGRTAVYRENYPKGTMVLGELLGGRFGLSIPLSGSARFAGKETSRQLLGSAMTGEAIDFLAPAGHSHLVIMVDQQRLFETASACRVARPALRAFSVGRPGMPVLASPFSVECIKDTFGKMIDSGLAETLHTRQDHFEDLVIDAVLSLVEQVEEPYGRPPASVLFRRAVEVADQFSYIVPIAVLASNLRVSPRTLHKAFVSACGMPPHQYFLKRRLNRVRRVLMAADPHEAFVTAIAMEAGFTELGRFSRIYREHFGENPSRTLRRESRKVFVIPG